jgi:hypothetical protein
MANDEYEYFADSRGNKYFSLKNSDDRKGCEHFVDYLKEYDSLNRIDSLYIRNHCTNNHDYEYIKGYDRFYECDTCEKLYCFSCGFDRCY